MIQVRMPSTAIKILDAKRGKLPRGKYLEALIAKRQ
jgi:hypothetical protein